MPCVVEEPEMKFDKHLEWMLCKACKHLTPEQMWEISNNSGWIGLYQWYSEHLLKDFINNYDNADPAEKNIALSEAARLGLKIYKAESGFCMESLNNQQAE